MQYDNILYERSAPLDEAFRKANDFLLENEITCSLESYGDKKKSFLCKLSKNGVEISNGGGKGVSTLEAKVSAIYEAIEHYSFHACSKNESLSIKSSHEILGGSSWYQDIPFSILGEQEKKVLCIPYTKIYSDEQIYLPLGLVNPAYIEAEDGFPAAGNFPSEKRKDDDFCYDQLIKYCNGNGIASGSSVEECLIHGTSEIIERYSVGEFLTKVIVCKKLQYCNIVNHESLPPDLKELYDIASSELFGGKIYILDITSTRWKIPTFLIYLDHPNPAFRTFSAGTSINKRYAMQRALTEMLQRRVHPHSLLNADDETIRKVMEDWHNRTYGEMNNHPVYNRFAFQNLSKVIETIEVVAYQNNDSEKINSVPLESYLNTLIEKISEAEGKVYFTKMIDHEHVKVVGSFIYPYNPNYIMMSGGLVGITRETAEFINASESQ